MKEINEKQGTEKQGSEKTSLEKKAASVRSIHKDKIDNIDLSHEVRRPSPMDFTTEIQAVKDILKKMESKLDDFYADPTKYNRKQLEKLILEFIHDLKILLKDTGYFPKIQEALKKDRFDFKGFFKKWKVFFQPGDVDAFGLDRELEIAIKPFFDFLYFKYFRVNVKGIANVPSEGRCILVANHSGVIPWDGAMLKVALFNDHSAKRDLRFLVDDFVFHFPFMGTLMNRIGGVRASQQNALKLLQENEIVSVFPEGIKGISKLYKDRYKLERFGRGGAIRLALKSDAPIVPVSIVGAEEIYPLLYKSHVLARPLSLPFIPFTPLFPWLGPLGTIPLPTKWTIEFGEPIYFDSSQKDLQDDIKINQETEKLREKIQAMLDKNLKERQGVFS